MRRALQPLLGRRDADTTTRRALAALPDSLRIERVLDLSCGTGGSAIVLAEDTAAHVTAVDIHPPFLATLRTRAEECGLADRITTVAADMANTDSPAAGFDLVWAEGSAYSIGFENALRRCVTRCHGMASVPSTQPCASSERCTRPTAPTTATCAWCFGPLQSRRRIGASRPTRRCSPSGSKAGARGPRVGARVGAPGHRPVEGPSMAGEGSMVQIAAKRVTARIDGDFVVFLIGMRLNKPWKVHKWLPVFRAMPKMIRELEARPESGFLGHIASPGVIVQYWRSFEHLEAYARDPNRSHWPAWVDFNTRVGASRGDVGIWHETYRVREGEYECVYSGMPPFGLAKASATIDAVGTFESARGRLEATESRRPSQPAT